MSCSLTCTVSGQVERRGTPWARFLSCCSQGVLCPGQGVRTPGLFPSIYPSFISKLWFPVVLSVPTALAASASVQSGCRQTDPRQRAVPLLAPQVILMNREVGEAVAPGICFRLCKLGAGATNSYLSVLVKCSSTVSCHFCD